MAILEMENAWQGNEADARQAAENLALVNGTIESFISEHGDVTDPHHRVDMSLSLTASLRGVLEEHPATQDYADGITAHTQLDILEWEALKSAWFMHSPILPGMIAPPGLKELRADEFLARERVLDDIETTHMISTGNELPAYEELINQYWRARLAVKNPPSAPVREKAMDAAILAQHLGVHKTVNGLREAGFVQTRRATLAEKNKGTDVVVPVGKLNVRSVGIKFQPGSKGAGGLSAYSANKTLLVNMPYERSENPFVMPQNDRRVLAGGVNDMRARLLAMGGIVKLGVAA